MSESGHNTTERRVDVQGLLTARTQSLATHNDPPSDAEVSELKRVVAEGSKDIADLAGEIETAHEHLGRLKKEMQNLRQAINTHKRVLNSPRRLNTDILMDVFELVCRSSDSDHNTKLESQDSLDVHRPAWRLSQVCHRWRTIITQDMPHLWTGITLVIDPKNVKRRFVLEQLLRHSRGRLLNVSLLFHETFRTKNVRNPLLQGLEVSCDRWRSLHIEGWAKFLRVWDASYLENNLPNLEIFSHRIHSDENPVISQLQFPRLSPRLTTLHMIGWPTLDDGIAWEKLKTLTWSHETTTNVHLRLPGAALLRRCDILEVCSLDCVFSKDPPQSEYVSVRKLHDLTLHSIVHSEDLPLSKRTRQTEVERFLHILHLPSLRSSAITGLMYAERSLVECLQKSQCNLQSLSLPTQHLDLESLERLLNTVPSLSQLCILDQRVGRRSLSVIKDIVSVAIGTCTQLQTLEINLLPPEAHSDDDDDDIVVEALATLIGRRKHSEEDPRMLETLRICTSSSSEAAKVQRALRANAQMQALIGEGFRVESSTCEGEPKAGAAVSIFPDMAV